VRITSARPLLREGATRNGEREETDIDEHRPAQAESH
jgi:hypothetical protein